MFKFTKLVLLVGISLSFLACSGYQQAMKVLPSELTQLNVECKRDNINFEMDCYDLLSSKNSFAQLRLGIHAQSLGKVEEAFERYTKAQKAGNFYANALLSDLYANGIGVEFNEKKAISLLQDAEEVDPIAAYKLSFYYLSHNNSQKAIELLIFAATNGLKDAQKELVLIYSNNQYIDENKEQAMYWDSAYQNGEQDFARRIYGR